MILNGFCSIEKDGNADTESATAGTEGMTGMATATEEDTGTEAL